MKMLPYLLLATIFGTSTAYGAVVTVTWTPPTTNTDGSVIPATGEGSIARYRIEYGTCTGTNTFGVKAGEVTRAAPATSTTVNLNPGTSCVRVFVNNTYGRESLASNVASRVVTEPTPNPPVLSSVAVQVYEVQPNLETFAFDRGRMVGTIKLGSTCDARRKSGTGYYALATPTQTVLSLMPRSTALVARCER